MRKTAVRRCLAPLTPFIRSFIKSKMS